MDRLQYNIILREQLRKYREDRNYSQQYVANYLQISRPAYSNYETGSRLPDIFTLDKLARLYNVSIEAFLYPPSLYNSFKKAHVLSYEKGHTPVIDMNDNEKLLIYRFRQLCERDQEEILHLAEYKAEH